MDKEKEKQAQKVRTLLSLLDDPDESIAAGGMGELLRYDEALLLPALGELQESTDPVLRKRVQQLESILTVRRRRKHFLELLRTREVDLVEGLVEVHLQWFDNDSKVSLIGLVQSFLEVAVNNELKTIEDLSSFMLRSGFETPPDDELCAPENYCIGTVLEDRIGSDLLLCVIALMVGAEAGMPLALVRIMGQFAVVSEEGVLISPANDWAVDRISRLQSGDFWNDPAAILKYASLMLFLYAVGSDSFRYVHTIGHSLTGADDREPMEFLPYPYGGKSTAGESCEEL